MCRKKMRSCIVRMSAGDYKKNKAKYNDEENKLEYLILKINLLLEGI